MKRSTVAMLLVAATGSAASLVPSEATGAVTASHATLTAIEVLTDRLDPIQGAVVRFSNGGAAEIAVTSADGQTPWRSLDPSPGVSLVLADKILPGGIALGMIEGGIPTPFLPNPAEDYSLLTISRTQPLAVPVQVEGLPQGMNNLFPPPGDYPHWRIAVPSASPLRFTLHVASLLDQEAITQYAAYRGHDTDPALEYVRGVALVVPTVQLGTEGILVGIALLGDLPSGVVVDVINFSSDKLSLTGPPLNVTVAGVHNDVVYAHLTGRVRKGHLALLARSSSGPPRQVRVLRDSPPNIAVPANAGEGIDVACVGCDRAAQGSAALLLESFPPTLLTDCEPPIPQPPMNWTCNPPPPPANHCGTPTAGEKQCKTVRSRGPLTCRSPGSTVTATQGKTASWKVSFNLTGADGTPLSSSGGFSYGQESATVQTDSWTAQGGASGLGECMRIYRFELVCAQAFTLMEDACLALSDGITTWADCVAAVTSSASCLDSSTSQTTCSRTQ